MTKQPSVFGFDIFLFIAAVFLMITGILFIYSSGVSSTGEVYSRDFVRQIIWVVSGLIIMLFFAFFNYNRLRELSIYIYTASILLLIATLIFGREVHGAKSWLGGDIGIQPSEFAKLATILMLASYLSTVGGRIQHLSSFIIALSIAFLPMIIILLQPDMGTALVYLPIALVTSLVAGTKLRYLTFILLGGLLMLVFGVLPSYEKYILGREIAFFYSYQYTRFVIIILGTIGGIGVLSFLGYFVYKRRYFYWICYFALLLFLSIAGSFAVQKILKDYQIMRLIIFIDPYIDPRGAGWNILQSVTAVGSGGFVGKGFLMGTQSHYQYLPQQSTDFIFSILAEEWGFLGGFFVLLMFLVITLRSIRILSLARDTFAVFTGAGILAMFLFHVVVNVGMAMGIMPIAGIPLLFLSRGGSALWTASAGIGILLNIYMRRYRY